jgi:hypothetical protein
MHAIATATHTHDRASLMGVMRFPVPHLDVIIVGLASVGFRLAQAAPDLIEVHGDHADARIAAVRAIAHIRPILIEHREIAGASAGCAIG